MKRKILLPLFIIMSCLLLFMWYNIVTNISNFNQNKEYFVKPVEQQNIKDWMTLNYIKRRYDINIEKIIWNDISIWNMNMTLKKYCKKYNIDCNQLIITLEKHKNGN